MKRRRFAGEGGKEPWSSDGRLAPLRGDLSLEGEGERDASPVRGSEVVLINLRGEAEVSRALAVDSSDISLVYLAARQTVTYPSLERPRQMSVSSCGAPFWASLRLAEEKESALSFHRRR